MNISQFLFSQKKRATHGGLSPPAINWANPVIMDSKFLDAAGLVGILFYLVSLLGISWALPGIGHLIPYLDHQLRVGPVTMSRVLPTSRELYCDNVIGVFIYYFYEQEQYKISLFYLSLLLRGSYLIY